MACWSWTRPICSNLLRCASSCCPARCRSWFPDSLWSWHDYQRKVAPQCQWLSWFITTMIIWELEILTCSDHFVRLTGEELYIYKAGELVELVGYSITYDINHDATIPMITIPYYTYNNGWRGLYSLYTSIHRRDRWEVAVPRWGHPCCPWRVWMFISANGCPNGWYSIV